MLTLRTWVVPMAPNPRAWQDLMSINVPAWIDAGQPEHVLRVHIERDPPGLVCWSCTKPILYGQPIVLVPCALEAGIEAVPIHNTHACRADTGTDTLAEFLRHSDDVERRGHLTPDTEL